MKINLARVYESRVKDGSYRVLVDRLWPRGIKKETLALDAWLKDLAPSDRLRRWFNHDPRRWDEFKSRYFNELREKLESIKSLIEDTAGRELTLLYGARDREHNQARALAEYLRENFMQKMS